MPYTQKKLRQDIDSGPIDGPSLVFGDGNWGEKAWHFLYQGAISFNGESADLHSFLKSLQWFLPCPDCREHYKEYLQANELPNDGYEAFNWLLNLENKIRREKGKQQKLSIVTRRRKSSYDQYTFSGLKLNVISTQNCH